MIVWGEERRTSDPEYFPRMATAEATKPVWLVSDCRRPTDLAYFQVNSHVLVILVILILVLCLSSMFVILVMYLSSPSSSSLSPAAALPLPYAARDVSGCSPRCPGVDVYRWGG